MRSYLLFFGAVACLAGGCESSNHAAERATTTAAPAPTTTAQTSVSPSPIALTIFKVDDGLLRPRVARVPRTRAVAAAALRALGVGESVSVDHGTATVALSRATQDEAAEIVYTLTQFSAIDRVDVAGRTGLTRDDFASYVPPIFVETPGAATEVPATFHVSGTASVFEATLVVQLLRDGNVIAKRSVTASEGAPGRGTFDTTLTAPPGEATIAAFAPSAADGAPQHEVDVPVTVGP